MEYIRRKVFGRQDHFPDLETAEQHLQTVLQRLNGTCQQLSGKTALELFEEEKEALWKTPEPLTCSESMPLRVDKYATVCYRSNRYSVPDHLVGRFVDVKIFSRKIEIFHENIRVSVHERSYGKHQWIINIEHFLATFKKKPGVLAGSVALARSSYLKRLYHEHFALSPREFIDLLHYCHHHLVSGGRLEESISRLMGLCTKVITTEKLIAMLGNKPGVTPEIPTSQDETICKSKEQLQQLADLF